MDLKITLPEEVALKAAKLLEKRGADWVTIESAQQAVYSATYALLTTREFSHEMRQERHRSRRNS